ncbi:phosphopentomutase [Seinonella peptonophila]|uniref:Phosphopentomutase n=1 Tax=Seinonella peptonophila TaxID=112248 RepID=A0A1M4TKC6_9BACL|nr:phosphopentomutase [Seinonella peptonophila]SHE44845.1 phosphopentomutase [Seinonella peptonophila]
MEQRGRAIVIVLDSVGIGALPDADQFGDLGSHTMGHIAESQGGLSLPHLEQFGLGNIEQMKGIVAVSQPKASYGRMIEISRGKDTTTGHWELMGIYTDKPFQTYPQGFPDILIHQIEQATGRKVVGNVPASGTAIIEQWGKHQLETGDLIIYTSADSVLQIAAHQDVISLEELYQVCEIARKLTLADEHRVVRVIARPFKGKPGSFVRTANRRDYSVKPPAHTVLNHLVDKRIEVVGVGKIPDIFANSGITQSIHTTSNDDGITKLVEALHTMETGFFFVNLVDFDSKYGHRRDPKGYKQALEAFDKRLPEVIDSLAANDLLIITADHGNDPTFHGTDHTREYVPLFVYAPWIQKPCDLGIRTTFADVGATIAEWFQVEKPNIGISFYQQLK